METRLVPLHSADSCPRTNAGMLAYSQVHSKLRDFRHANVIIILLLECVVTLSVKVMEPFIVTRFRELDEVVSDEIDSERLVG